MDYFLIKILDTHVKGEIAELFLSKETNVNPKTKNSVTALHVATQKGYTKVVEALFEYNADVNSVVKSDITPLHFAAQKGCTKIIEIIFKFGSEVDSRDGYG